MTPPSPSLSGNRQAWGLVGDVGGTNARFALARWVDGNVDLSWRAHRRVDAFNSLDAVVADYLAEVDAQPDTGVIAVAGPVQAGDAHLTNVGWRLSADAMRETLRFGRLSLVNDFEAQARGAPWVDPKHLLSLGGPLARPKQGTIAVVGAGTGFGVAALARASDGTEAAISGEGGHVGFAPVDPVEDAVLQLLRARFSRVSVERLLSGPGLETLYQALGEIAGRRRPALPASRITELGLSSGEADCVETLERFCAILGSVAGDVALTTGAVGGVYLSGGIAPRLAELLRRGSFRRRFEEKGRFTDYMRSVPTWLITTDETPLIGAARLL